MRPRKSSYKALLARGVNVDRVCLRFESKDLAESYPKPVCKDTMIITGLSAHAS